MKRLGMLLVLFSVCAFTLGCPKPEATTPPATDETKVEATEGADATDAKEGDTADENKEAEGDAAPE